MTMIICIVYSSSVCKYAVTLRQISTSVTREAIVGIKYPCIECRARDKGTKWRNLSSAAVKYLPHVVGRTRFRPW